MSATSSRKVVAGAQPSSAFALLASPMSRSTSAGAQERRVDHHVVLPGEARRLEGGLHELAHAVGLAGGEDVVAGLVALQHGVHAGHVLPRVAPVALGVQVAQAQLALLAVLDARHRQADLARHELRPAQRALVVEEDARGGVQARTPRGSSR
jgi:hypothetical protein